MICSPGGVTPASPRPVRETKNCETGPRPGRERPGSGRGSTVESGANLDARELEGRGRAALPWPSHL